MNSPVSVNTFIGFKAVPKVLQLFSCVGKCLTKGHNSPLGLSLVNFCVTSYGCLLHFHVCEELFVFYSRTNGT